MKQAIINLINSLSERIKPHRHEWELIDESDWYSKINPDNKWIQWTYRCKSCGKESKIDNK
jgi:hypothetical protein